MVARHAYTLAPIGRHDGATTVRPMTTLTYNVPPILLSRRAAAVALDTSEKRIYELVRNGYLTERYMDTKPRYLYSELVEYADSLPTERR